METFDIGLAWNWEFDHAFIHGLESACHTAGLTTYRIDPTNIVEATKKVRTGRLSFRTFLDRASDDDEEFLPLAKLIAQSPCYIFNRYDRVEYAKDKANMHLALLGEGIDIPYTIIVSPYNKEKEIVLSLTELEHLGRPFIIKPANTTGGGTGVVLGAETLKEILDSRQHHKNDTYLLQETVVPRTLDGKKAWFRVFHCCGTVLACWWDHETHIYREVSPEERKKFHLKRLEDIALKIFAITGLDFFSSEVTIDQAGKFVAVDYVNEICDMREQSRHFDGVPDAVIGEVKRSISMRAKSLCRASA